MSCRICARNNCIQSFHSLEEQDEYEEALNLYDIADDTKKTNRKRQQELEKEIEELEDEIENAYDEAREKRQEIADDRVYR